MSEDAELARRAAAGEQAAVGQIYDRYAPLVRAVLLDATGEPAEADELVQEVFVRAIGSLRQLREPAALVGWLVAIARREATEYRRRQARDRSRYVALEQEPEQPSSNAADEARRIVQAALAEMPDDERLALHIHYLCGEPAAVARQALKLSSSGFYKLLERARERLRMKLLDREAKS